MSSLETIKKKIIDGLSQIKTAPGPAIFTYWLHGILNEEDKLVFLKKEIEEGDEAVDDWLAEVLVESGRYETGKEKKGHVRVRQTHQAGRS